MNDDNDEYGLFAVDVIRKTRNRFLDSLVHNEDGSITIIRVGVYHSEGLLVNKSPGIPEDTDNHISRVADELGYRTGETVRYEIRILPPERKPSQ
ncbi:hypothetical protein J4476_02225 [Candidatus Woesearchaeota archaeon]|nr:MAG: hypothetical protein QT09_C0007G0036 [archaeon GW2011_AR18]MBS3161489.1 hypothetical protein [Candidatus Woesearchaeota archaeon]HIH25466.1 hypothetical protein [Nanoarchaeota archaeon]